MRYTISTLLVALFMLPLMSQDGFSSLLESLEKVKSETNLLKRDTLLIWQYNYIAEELSRRQDQRVTNYLDTLYQIATKSTWPSAMAFYHRAMGRMYDFSGKFSDALNEYEKALSIYKTANGSLKEYAFCYVLKGFLLSNSDLNAECWSLFEEALPIAEKAESKNSLCLILDWFGDYYYYGLDGEVDNQKALDYYLKVNAILPQISYTRIIADNYAVLSGVYYRLGDLKSGNKYFDKAVELAMKENHNFVLFGLYAEKARALSRNGEHKAANVWLLKADTLLVNETNIEFKARLERELYLNYKALGDAEKSLLHHEKWIDYENTMKTDEVAKKYQEIESKYDLAQKEAQIDALKSANLKNVRNLLILLLCGVGIGAYLLWRKNYQLESSYKELNNKNAEVEKALYLGERQERQRVAGELHDNVNTKIAAARWRMEAISDQLTGGPKAIVDETIEMMQHAYDDVRHISHNLVPSQLKDLGLLNSVDGLLKKLNISGKVKFEISGQNLDETKIENQLYPLYNIIFELINNVLKHAEASNCTVDLVTDLQYVTVIVSDDGKGFVAHSIKKGFGLKSILNRVEGLGGTIAIESAPLKGSSTTVRIPINKS